jgi:hypothetical protein
LNVGRSVRDAIVTQVLRAQRSAEDDRMATRTSQQHRVGTAIGLRLIVVEEEACFVEPLATSAGSRGTINRPSASA